MGAFGLHDETLHVTCEMVVRQCAEIIFGNHVFIVMILDVLNFIIIWSSGS